MSKDIDQLLSSFEEKTGKTMSNEQKESIKTKYKGNYGALLDKFAEKTGKPISEEQKEVILNKYGLKKKEQSESGGSGSQVGELESTESNNQIPKEDDKQPTENQVPNISETQRKEEREGIEQFKEERQERKNNPYQSKIDLLNYQADYYKTQSNVKDIGMEDYSEFKKPETLDSSTTNVDMGIQEKPKEETSDKGYSLLELQASEKQLKANNLKDIYEKEVDLIGGNALENYNKYLKETNPEKYEYAKKSRERGEYFFATDKDEQGANKDKYLHHQEAIEWNFNRLNDLKEQIIDYKNLNAYANLFEKENKSEEEIKELEKLQSDPLFNDVFKIEKRQEELIETSKNLLKKDDYSLAKEYITKIENETAAREEKLKKRFKEKGRESEFFFSKPLIAVQNAVTKTMGGLLQMPGSLVDRFQAFSYSDTPSYGWTNAIQDMSRDYVERRTITKSSRFQQGMFNFEADYGDSKILFNEEGDVVSVRDKDGYAVSEEKATEVKNAYLADDNKPKPKEKFNVNQFVDQGLDVLADLGTMFVGGSGMVKGLSLTGKSATIGSKAAVTGIIAAQMQKSIYEQAIGMGMTKDEASRYSNDVSIVIGLTNLIFGMEARIIQGSKSQFVKEITKNSVRNSIAKEGFKNATINTIRNYGSAIIKNGFGEGLEESVLEKLTEMGVTGTYNLSSETRVENVFDYREARDNFLLGSAMGIFGGAIEATQNQLNSKKRYNAFIFNSSFKKDNSLKVLSELEKEQEITKEQATQARKDIKEASEITSQLPNELDDNKKFEYFELGKERAELEKKGEEIADKNLKTLNNAKISEIDKKQKEILGLNEKGKIEPKKEKTQSPIEKIEAEREGELKEQKFGDVVIQEDLTNYNDGELSIVGQGSKEIRNDAVQAYEKGFISAKELKLIQAKIKLWLESGMSLKDVSVKIKEQFDIKVSAGKWQLAENKRNSINAKYDAEIAKLEQSTEEEAETGFEETLEDEPTKEKSTRSKFNVQSKKDYTPGKSEKEVDDLGGNNTIAESIDEDSVYEKDGKEGRLRLDGQTVVFETSNEIIELGNKNQISSKKLKEYGILQQKQDEVEIAEDNTVTVNGKTYKNNFSKPEMAVTQKEDGSYSVSLETESGEKRTFRGRAAEEIAYQIKLKEVYEEYTPEQQQEVERIADEEIAKGETESTTDKETVGDTEPSETKQFADKIGKSESIEDVMEGGVALDVDGTEIILTEDESGITLESVKSKEKGRGNAKKALKKLTDAADEDGKQIKLKVVPEDADTDKDRLQKLYEDNGFVMQEDGLTMVREPKNEQIEENKAEVETEPTVETGLEGILDDDTEVETGLEGILEEEKPKTKSPEQKQKEERISKAEDRLSKARQKLEAKKKEFGKKINEDQADLFGERKSNKGQLFDERVSQDAATESLKPFVAEVEKAKKELKKAKESDVSQETKDLESDIQEQKTERQKRIEKAKKENETVVETKEVEYRNATFEVGVNKDGKAVTIKNKDTGKEVSRTSEYNKKGKKTIGKNTQFSAIENKMIGAVSSATIENEIKDKINSDTPKSPLQHILQYLIFGGKMDKNEIYQELGIGSRLDKSGREVGKSEEAGAKKTLLTNRKGNTIDDLIESLKSDQSVEYNTDIDDSVYRNEILDVMRNHNTKAEMIETYLGTMQQEQQYTKEDIAAMERIEKEKQAKKEKIAKEEQLEEDVELEEAVESIDEFESYEQEFYAHIAENFVNEDGLLDTEKTEEYLDTVFPPVNDYFYNYLNKNHGRINNREVLPSSSKSIESKKKDESKKPDENEQGQVDDFEVPFQEQSKEQKLSEKALEKLTKVLNKAFPNIKVNFKNSEEIAKDLKLTEGAIPPLGYVKDGEVFINTDKATTDTPIHEFGHIWNEYIKNNHKEVYDKGIELVEGTQYEKDVRNNPVYANNSKESILEEALAQAIGEKGAKFLKAKENAFKAYIKELFDKVKNALGITSMSSEQLADLTLEKFTDLAAAELLSGNEISKEVKSKEPSKTPPKEPDTSNPNNSNLQKRAKSLIDKIVNLSKGISSETKKSIEDEVGLYYDVQTNQQTIEMGNALIEQLGGIDKAVVLAMDETKYMPFDMRSMILGTALNQYSLQESDMRNVDNEISVMAKIDELLNKQKTIANTFDQMARTAGRGIQFMSKIYASQGIAIAERVSRKIDESNTKSLDQKVGPKGETAREMLTQFEKTINGLKKEVVDLAKENKSLIERLKAKAIKMSKSPKEKTQKFKDKVAEKYKNISLSVVSSEIQFSAKLTPAQQAFYKAIEASVKEIKRSGDKAKVIKKGMAALKKHQGYKKATKEQKKTIEDAYNNHTDKIFKEADEELTVENRKRELLDEIDFKELIGKHYSNTQKEVQNIVTVLMNEYGLTKSEAKKLNDEITAEVNKTLKPKIEKALINFMGSSRLPSVKRKRKTVLNKMMEAINNGAFTSKLNRELFAYKFNLTNPLTNKQIQRIKELAENVELSRPGSAIETKATRDIAKYITELYPENVVNLVNVFVGLRYASMLSGPFTTVINMWSNAWNYAIAPFSDLLNPTSYFNDKRRNPIQRLFTFRRDANNWANSWNLAVANMIEGTQNYKQIESISRDNKFTISELEREKYNGHRFKLGFFNPYNYARYVGRFLAAQDAFMTNLNFEREMYQNLYDVYSNQGYKGKDLRTMVSNQMAILNTDTDKTKKIQKQADKEFAQYEKLSGKKLSNSEKAIRLQEIIYNNIEDLTEDAKDELMDIAKQQTFTGERNGTVAKFTKLLSTVSNHNIASKLATMNYIPFTTVVGNISEYMLDHAPFYGILRANGLSVSGIYSRSKRVVDGGKFFGGFAENSAMMGERGTRKYEIQMGRAMLGTATLLGLGALFIGRTGEDDDEFYLTGSLKAGTDNYGTQAKEALPAYTLKLPYTPGINFLNIPALSIPLTLIGNYNDLLRKHKADKSISEDEMNLRFAVAAETGRMLWLDATKNTSTMVLDMSILQGVSKLVSEVGTAFRKAEETEESITDTQKNKPFKGLIKNIADMTIGQVGDVLFWNINLKRQIEKIMTGNSYTYQDLKGYMAYKAGINYFVNKPRLDIYGQEVKGFPGDQFINISYYIDRKGKDSENYEVDMFLLNNAAIPNKIKNTAGYYFDENGLEYRYLTEEEHYEYIKLAGEKFLNAPLEITQDGLPKPKWTYMGIKGYMEFTKKPYFKNKKMESRGEPITTIQKDVAKLWQKAKSEAKIELGLK